MNLSFDLLLDTCGLLCPEPVMLLHGAVRDVSAGGVIKVIATDPSTSRDIPKFCQFLGHELISSSEHDDHYIYFIRRG
ncbi:MAG: sulfurtransferase TusA [Gammaproteobacteria bacterium]|nr:sulfurtransferase TusA [Gammaproteobacteria bacterium]MBQ0839425.1 sulfurtransferase TusA [Gammaproteobacteria bacterium]